GQFTVIAETIPPGASETKHYHDKTEQVFYVLKGRLTIEINEINHMLEENECITVMPCTPHKVFNQSNAAVHFLVISCPNSHEDRINVDD
ncbi:MAG: cupin domain-containing protein, partial [Alphaproteobacteria bacterium]|nr:cupin domain-containing protein [Alphaproteobacteria bacterium]